MRYFLSSFFFFIFQAKLNAQDYHAVQGSSFAGSVGVANNPASIVNTPFPWDVDIISLQLKSATNAYTINNYSLISSPKNLTVLGASGDYSRYADINFNINLLNARIALNRKQAIAFGANLRGYGNLKTGAYNYSDTLHNSTSFFNHNDPLTVYNGNFTGSSWLEAFLTYSQTIWDDGQGRLNGGITVKAMRGVGGAFAKLQNGSVNFNGNSTNPVYTLNTAIAGYSYSYNFDGWQNKNSTTENLKNFLENTRGGFSADIGFEYLIKSQSVSTYFNDDDYFDYDWKIGVSILDIGHNQYRYGDKGRYISSPAQNVTDSVLNEKFNSIPNLQAFSDSVSSISNGYALGNEKFKVQDPTRIVVNVDKPLGNDFYLNAELSVNFSSSFGTSKTFYVESLNLLTFTPRWETIKWGVYMPIQYNMEKQFWIGGAFKIGPLLLGIHNWANVFAKNKMQDGGGYVALVVHPSRMTKKKTDKRLECPKQ